MTKRFWAGVVVFGVLLAVGSLQAHHSLAGVYDLKKVERATGVVQKFAFTNPHGALHIEIKDKQGVPKVWPESIAIPRSVLLSRPNSQMLWPTRSISTSEHMDTRPLSCCRCVTRFWKHGKLAQLI